MLVLSAQLGVLKAKLNMKKVQKKLNQIKKVKKG